MYKLPEMPSGPGVVGTTGEADMWVWVGVAEVRAGTDGTGAEAAEMVSAAWGADTGTTEVDIGF